MKDSTKINDVLKLGAEKNDALSDGTPCVYKVERITKKMVFLSCWVKGKQFGNETKVYHEYWTKH